MNPPRSSTSSRPSAPPGKSDGLLAVVCGVMGAVLVAAPWLLSETSPEYGKRWVVFVVGLMLLATGSQFSRQRFRARISPESNAVLDALAAVVVYGAFAVVTLAGAFLFGDEIRGGTSWFSPEAGNRVGRVVFGLIGVLLAALTLSRVVVLARRVRVLFAGRRQAP